VHGCEQEKSSINHWFIPFALLLVPKKLVMTWDLLQEASSSAIV
jgi:hypothetical protein